MFYFSETGEEVPLWGAGRELRGRRGGRPAHGPRPRWGGGAPGRQRRGGPWPGGAVYRPYTHTHTQTHTHTVTPILTHKQTHTLHIHQGIYTQGHTHPYPVTHTHTKKTHPCQNRHTQADRHTGTEFFLAWIFLPDVPPSLRKSLIEVFFWSKPCL